MTSLRMFPLHQNQSTAYTLARCLTEEADEIGEPKPATAANDIYFETLHLQPIQLDLSFMRTETLNSDSKCVRYRWRAAQANGYAGPSWTTETRSPSS